MLSFTGALRVFVALEPCDMRKGFDGLSGMVATKLNEDLQSGALFVFANRSHTRLKIIFWMGWRAAARFVTWEGPSSGMTHSSAAKRRFRRNR